MKQASTNTVKWVRKDGGATAPIPSTAAVPRINPTADPHPVPAGLSAEIAVFTTGVPATGFLADTTGVVAGGGQVTAPSFTTVAPRITSSSMFTTSVPSFAGDSSARRLRTLVE